MPTSLYPGQPDKETIRYFKYYRKAAVTNNKILKFIYRRIAIYYENKHLRKLLK